MDYLKELLPGFYKQQPIPTVIAIFLVYNAFAVLTWIWVRGTASKPEAPAQIQVNGSIQTGNCSAAGIVQANGVSIQCDDKTATLPENSKAGQKK
ncbi:MAG TPA: hypothetical protein VHT24_11515 [Pseudacidobacterium sp.]|jgi:hypothetical protein|nr:hypothetical protein [Pseudacidobacterium sp.]